MNTGVSPPYRRRETPGTTIGGSHGDRDSTPIGSPLPIVPHADIETVHAAPTAVDLAHPIVALIHEIAPRIPLSVVASLVVETLDLASCMILDGQWAEARQAQWPEAARVAHSQHIGVTYLERRRREALDALPRRTDYPGRGQVA